jgi:NodT family efflux transporter outer membrane factor (OMF) lipoprotein
MKRYLLYRSGMKNWFLEGVKILWFKDRNQLNKLIFRSLRFLNWEDFCIVLKTNFSIAIGILFLLLSGCMVGPNYKKKEPPMPSKYTEEKIDDLSISSLKDWWKTFDDPVLDELIKEAIINNYSLKIAIEKIEETRAYYRLSKANLFPEINLTASAYREKFSQNNIINSFIPVEAYNEFKIGFDALWEIDIFGKLRREKEAAFYQLQSSQESMRGVYITLISDVARFYVDICSTKNIIDLTKRKIALEKEIYRLTANLKSTGIDSQINEEAEKAILSQEEENLIFYNTFLSETSYQLAILLGKQPEGINKQVERFTTIPSAENKIKIGMPSTLLRRRPDIRMAERNLAAATAQTGAAIAEYFPSFSLSGATKLDASKLSKLFYQNSFQGFVNAMFDWPILNFGRVRANVDVKKSEQKQALLYYEDSVLNALKDVEWALVAYYNEGESLKKIVEEVAAYSRISTLEKNKYLNGLDNLSEYYEAEKTSIDSRIKEIESKRALVQNLIALYKALGGGEWE